MNMNEQDRLALSRFDAVWARVQPESAAAQTAPCPAPDDAEALRSLIDQTSAAAKVLCVLARREPRCAARLRALACERSLMARQLQGAYYLLTAERHTPGASCTVRHESAACLRCLWQTSRNQAAHARRFADETDEPLLQTLYAELAELLDAQCEALWEILCAVLG